jgi:hypothetical protein
MVEYTAFAVGCVLTLVGCVCVLVGRVPSRLPHVGRPRPFGVWCVCTGVFCTVQLPALHDRVVAAGTLAVDGVLLLVPVGAAALFLSSRRR